MTTSSLRDEAAAETMRIADNLVAEGRREKTGLMWETLRPADDGSLVSEGSPYLYAGVAGISLFLLEMYSTTGAVRYRETAIESARWVRACVASRPVEGGFHSGHGGLLYFATRLAAVLRDPSWLEWAVVLARNLSNFAPRRRDLTTGDAGSLLGALHVHAATREREILRVIRALCARLAASAVHARRGLYWDRGPSSVKGLCGMSHGASGVAFALLEMAAALKDEGALWLAEQAFLFERDHFDRRLGNWPDMRVIPEPSTGRLSFTPRDYNAWCHGAAGIGLVRLRAFELTKNAGIRAELEQALRKTETTVRRSMHRGRDFTLCHGLAGQAELFQETSRVSGDDVLSELAAGVVRAAIASRRELGEYHSGFPVSQPVRDRSLFMGDAGIGYFLLRFLDPAGVPSVQSPSLPVHGEIRFRGTSSRSLHSMRKLALAGVFPRTIELSTRMLPRQTRQFLARSRSANRKTERDAFADFIRRHLRRSATAARQLRDCFRLESAMASFDSGVPNDALLHERELRRIGNGRLLTVSSSQTFQMNPDVRIRDTLWDWLGGPEQWRATLSSPPARRAVLMRRTASGVRLQSLLPATAALLRKFVVARRVADAIETTAGLAALTESERIEARRILEEQIEAAVHAAILLPPDAR